MSEPKKDKLADLRALIGHNIKSVAPAEPKPTPEPKAEEKGREVAPKKTADQRVHKPAPAANKSPARSGRGMQFYLDDSDRKTIHGLAVWFGSQDRRVSDSQVIKAAIRLAYIQTNARLLEICDEVRAGDRRLQKSDHKKPAQ